MKAKEYHKKYFPNLLEHAAKMISAMESECYPEKYGNKIFDSTAEIFSKFSYGDQNIATAILNIAMERIWTFNAKSLEQRNKEHGTFFLNVEKMFFKSCEDERLDPLLIDSMRGILRTVWKEVGRQLEEQNRRVTLYKTLLDRNSKKLNI